MLFIKKRYHINLVITELEVNIINTYYAFEK